MISLSPRLLVSLSPCLVLFTGTGALAQTPAGTMSAADQNRVPIAQLGTPSRSDQNRVPIYNPNQPSVMRQAPIGHFPTPAVVPQVNQYRPPRPGLSPYLNLAGGRTGGLRGGVGAVDYYNFVRPAQQALGSYSGRQMGPFNPAGRYGDVALDSTAQLPPETVTHSAGTASTFMNTQPYFNSMGTIGSNTPLQQTRPPIRVGRR